MPISDPTDLSPWAWYDRGGWYTDAAKATPAATPDDLVYVWADASGNGRDMTQATSGDRPFYVIDPGDSNPTLEFRGSEHLVIPDMSGFTQGEVFIVLDIDADPPAASADTGLWTIGTALNSTHYPWTDGTIEDGAGSTVRKTVGNVAADLTAVHLYNVESSLSGWTARIDGTTVKQEPSNIPGFAAAGRLGLSTGSGSYRLKGRVRQFLIFDRVLTLSERTDLHAWLASENPDLGEIAGPIYPSSPIVTPADLGFTASDDLSTIHEFSELQGCTVLNLPPVVTGTNPLTLGRWTSDRPVRIRQGHTAILGDNRFTTEVYCTWRGGIHIGRRRLAIGTDISLDHWPNVAGDLDGSTGNRWGFRSYMPDFYGTHGHFCSLAMPFSPFSQGPRRHATEIHGWRGVRGGATWTLGWLSTEADGSISRGTYLDSGEGRYLGAPLMIACDGAGNLRFDVGTGDRMAPVRHSFRVVDDDPPGSPGLRWIAFHCDPIAGEVWCAIDGIVKAVSTSDAGTWINGATYPAGTGATWGTDEAEFLATTTGGTVLGVKNSHGWIHQDGDQAGGPNTAEFVPGDEVKPANEWQPTLDVTWCGLHVAAGRRFAEGSPGDAVSWLPGGPEATAGDTLNHSAIFYGQRSNCMGVLPFGDPPGTLTLRGYVGSSGSTTGGGGFPAYVISRPQRFGAGDGIQLEWFELGNLKFSGAAGDFWCPIINFGTNYLYIHDCDLDGRPVAWLADAGQAASWMHRIEGCTASGWHASIVSNVGSYGLRNVAAAYETYFWVGYAANVWADRLFLYPSAANGRPIGVFVHLTAENGGEIHVSESMVDIEIGASHPFLKAMGSAGASGANISISRIGLSLGDEPVFVLDGQTGLGYGTLSPRQTLTIDSMSLTGAGIAGGTPMVAVQNDDAGRWRGSLMAPAGTTSLLTHPVPATAESNFDAAIPGEAIVWSSAEKDEALAGIAAIVEGGGGGGGGGIDAELAADLKASLVGNGIVSADGSTVTYYDADDPSVARYTVTIGRAGGVQTRTVTRPE